MKTSRADAPMAMLHELSHVLVDIEPDMVDEITSAMLKFEHATARILKLQWASWMEDYQVIDTDEVHWPELTTKERGELLNRSFISAKNEGILDEDGRPTYRLSENLKKIIASSGEHHGERLF